MDDTGITAVAYQNQLQIVDNWLLLLLWRSSLLT